MPGLEMPARGAGAAMLRELRDEERPPLEERPLLDEHPAPMDISSLEPPLAQSSNTQSNQSYDNMTNNLTDNKATQKEGNKETKPDRKKSIKPTAQSAIKPDSQLVSQSAGQSVGDMTLSNMTVADMIRLRTAHRGEQEVLKTVTLKLSPALDEKIERYCFDNKMKKQEFWAEAAALYFETIGSEMIAQREEA